MMPSTPPCASCGWVNAPTDAACRRCNALLAPPAAPSAYGAPPAAPGYGPPPTGYAGQPGPYAPPPNAGPFAPPPNPYGAAPNPYAPPFADAYASAQGAGGYRAAPYGELATMQGVWREGDLLVAYKSASLPDRCVCCNAPANGRRQRLRLSWHHPAVYIAAISPVIYLILALALRKNAQIEVGLCETHARRRRVAAYGASGVALASIASFVLAGNVEDELIGFFVLGGLLGLLAALLWFALGRRTVVPTKIDEHYVWMRGLPQSYLAGFPGSATRPYDTTW